MYLGSFHAFADLPSRINTVPELMNPERCVGFATRAIYDPVYVNQQPDCFTSAAIAICESDVLNLESRPKLTFVENTSRNGSF